MEANLCHTHHPAEMEGQDNGLCYSSMNFSFKKETSHTSGDYFFSCLYLLGSEMDFSMFKLGTNQRFLLENNLTPFWNPDLVLHLHKNCRKWVKSKMALFVV